MNFSFIKDDKVNLNLLIKKWTSNFSITEYLIWKQTTHMDLATPKYFLSVFRNKRFYEFDLTKDEANFVIWFLDLVSFMKGFNVSHFRTFYRKEDHAKVIHGYNSVSDVTFDQEYGPENYKEKLLLKGKLSH